MPYNAHRRRGHHGRCLGGNYRRSRDRRRGNPRGSVHDRATQGERGIGTSTTREALTWGDVDEPRWRWRVSSAVAKTGRARWVPVPDVLFEAVTALVAREDRVPERPVFQDFDGARFRTALARACNAAGASSFSPHDLRHRRVSLLHLGGMPWARIRELVGHDDLVTTARTYTHVVADEGELDYAELAR
jgi:integrase